MLGGFLSLLVGSAWSSVAPMDAPFVRHVFGMLNLWLNETSRADVLLPWADNEANAWFSRALARLPATDAGALREEYRQYWSARAPDVYEALGTTSPMSRVPLKGLETGPQQGATITYISPPRHIVGALDFENRNGIEEGLQLGHEAARAAVKLSAH